MPDAKLVFGTLADNSARLVFGHDDGSATPSVPPAVISLDAQLSDLHGHITLHTVSLLGGDVDLPGLDGHIDLHWDAGVSRGLHQHLHAHWQAAQPTSPASVRPYWQRTAQAQGALVGHWQQARRAQSQARLSWRATMASRAACRVLWQAAIPRRASWRTHWQTPAPHRAALCAHWQPAQSIRAAIATHWQDHLRLRASLRQHWQTGNPQRAFSALAWHDATRVTHALRTHWQEAMRPPSGTSPSLAPPLPERPLCYDPATVGQLEFMETADGQARLVFVCHHPGTRPPPARTAVPVRRVYIMINQIDLHLLDSGTPLPAYTLALSIDVDSWTWSWSATLHGQTLAHLAPARAGQPLHVQASINGTPYRLLIEHVQRERRFASERIHVSGRGIAAVLDQPYAPQTHFANAGSSTAHQLMLDALTVNGVNNGWTVDWQLTNWLIPPGVWSHHGTAISALSAIAQAAGGYLQPHPTEPRLRVLHRYPTAPWHWAGIQPDIDLTLDPVSVEAIQWQAKPAYNRVHLSGDSASGILARVKRQGTGGDIDAPMVVDPLITHADAAAQRARAILSDTGPQAMVTLTLPVLPQTGLILPGTFIRRADGQDIVQGYVRSTALSWENPRLRQTIEVQAHA